MLPVELTTGETENNMTNAERTMIANKKYAENITKVWKEYANTFENCLFPREMLPAMNALCRAKINTLGDIKKELLCEHPFDGIRGLGPKRIEMIREWFKTIIIE